MIVLGLPKSGNSGFKIIHTRVSKFKNQNEKYKQTLSAQLALHLAMTIVSSMTLPFTMATRKMEANITKQDMFYPFYWPMYFFFILGSYFTIYDTINILSMRIKISFVLLQFHKTVVVEYYSNSFFANTDCTNLISANWMSKSMNDHPFYTFQVYALDKINDHILGDVVSWELIPRAGSWKGYPIRVMGQRKDSQRLWCVEGGVVMKTVKCVNCNYIHVSNLEG